MTKRTLFLTIIGLLIAASLLALSTTAITSGNLDAQDSTQQQQTIDAEIQQRFTQTVAAQQVPVNEADLTQTAVFAQTLDAAFGQALTATAQASILQTNRDSLMPILPGNAVQMVELGRIAAGSGIITHVTFDTTGNTLFTVSEDMIIHQWDIATGAEILQFAGHTNAITALALSGDNTLLATAAYDGTIRLWDAPSGTQVQALDTGGRIVLSLAFDMTNTHLVTGDDQGNLTIWEVPQGVTVRTIPAHTGTVNGVAYRPPDDRFIVSVGNDGLAKLWDAQTGADMRNLDTTTTPLLALAFSSDGRYTAIAADQAQIQLWDIFANIQLGDPNDAGSYTSLAFDPTGQIIAASGVQTNGFRLWDTQTGTKLVEQALAAPVNAVAFNAQGTLLATGGDSAQLWGIVPGGVTVVSAPTEVPPVPTEAPPDNQPPTPIDPTRAVYALTATQDQADLLATRNALAIMTSTPKPVGFPTDVFAELQIVEQAFEHGRMLWLSHNRQIWIMELDISGIPGGAWYCYNDTFEDGEPETDPSLVPPEGMLQPIRGFGKVWRNNPEIRDMLGWATSTEFEFTSGYSYIADGTLDASGNFVYGPGEHRMNSVSGLNLAFYEEGIRGDCIGGTWHIR